MARTAQDTRDRILAAAYGRLYREGFARVSLDAIAADARLTKRTLYYHFASKDDLVAAVLEAQNALALEQIQGWGGGLGDDPAGFIDGMFDGLARWAATPRWTGSGFTRVAMELADLPGHPARAAAGRHKAAVESWLAGRLAAMRVAEPQRAARQMVLLMEGCLSLMLIHRDTAYARAAADAAKRLVR